MAYSTKSYNFQVPEGHRRPEESRRRDAEGERVLQSQPLQVSRPANWSCDPEDLGSNLSLDFFLDNRRSMPRNFFNVA